VSPDGEDFFELKGTLMKGVSQIFVNAPEEQGIEPIECRKLVVSVRGSAKQPTRISHLAISFIATGINLSQ